MHHKRGRTKHQRASCLVCQPSKLTAHVMADRAAANRFALADQTGERVTDQRLATPRWV